MLQFFAALETITRIFGMRRNMLKGLRLKGISCFIALLFMVLSLGRIDALALSAGISISSASAGVGSDVILGVTVSSNDKSPLGSVNIMLNYDEKLLEFLGGTNAEGGAGSIRITNDAGNSATKYDYQLKFRGKAEGESPITVSTWEIYDPDSKMATLDKQGAGKITVAAAAAAPSSSSQTETKGEKGDASLRSLQVSPGSLSPAFSSGVLEYRVSVDSTVPKLSVTAATNDPKAKVVITGNNNLKDGENTVTCKVTAQDGVTMQSYTILVAKGGEAQSSKQGDGIKAVEDTSVLSAAATTPAATAAAENGLISIGGLDYTLAAEFDPATLPEGFTAGTYTFQGQEVMAGKDEENGLLLLYLEGTDGNGDFFLYDEKTNGWVEYSQITVNTKTITVIPLEEGVELPPGLVESTLNLNGKKINGWIWGSPSLDQEYCVVYGMNSQGKKDFYRFDLEEKTVQRYFQDPNVDTGVSSAEYLHMMDRYDALTKSLRTRTYLLIGVGIIAFLLLLALCLVMLGVYSVKSTGGGLEIKRSREQGSSKGEKSRERSELPQEPWDMEDLDERELESSARRGGEKHAPRHRLREEAYPAANPKHSPVEVPAPKPSEPSEDDDFETFDI